MKLYYTASQAAKILTVSSETLRRWEVCGKLPFIVTRTPGGHRRYLKTDIDAFAKTLKKGKRPQAKNIPAFQTVTAIEAIRRRPGMYIGSTKSRGLNNLASEVIEYAFDKARQGLVSQIHVVISADQTVKVSDNGSGFSNDFAIPANEFYVDYVMTNLHIGNTLNLEQDTLVIANALSRWMMVETQYEDAVYTSLYRAGNIAKAGTRIRRLKANEQAGTIIKWQFDNTIFGHQQYDIPLILKKLEACANLVPGLTCILESPGIQEVFYNPDGIERYVTDKTNQQPPIGFQYSDENFDLDLFFNWSEDTNHKTHSFVNFKQTVDGGSHVDGAIRGIKAGLEDYIGQDKLVKPIKMRKLLEGFYAAIHVTTKDGFLFPGYTYSRLNDRVTGDKINEFVREQFNAYLHSNQVLADKLIQKLK